MTEMNGFKSAILGTLFSTIVLVLTVSSSLANEGKRPSEGSEQVTGSVPGRASGRGVEVFDPVHMDLGPVACSRQIAACQSVAGEADANINRISVRKNGMSSKA